MIKSQRDFWAGLLFAGIGIATAAAAAQHMDALPAPSVPGTGTLLLGAVLALLGITVLFTSLTIETEGGEPVRGRGGSALLAVAGSAIVYAATVHWLGAWWAVTATALAACTAVGGRVWPVGVLALAAALLAAAVLLWLGVGMPLPLPLPSRASA